VKLTPTPFMVRAAVEALKAFPELNASIEGDNVVYKKDINIGIAVALDWGLIVPVAKHADDLSLSGIAKVVADLAERARTKKLAPDDVQGAPSPSPIPGSSAACSARRSSASRRWRSSESASSRNASSWCRTPSASARWSS